MLVLTRKTKQSIQIGDDIEIQVLAIEGDQVRLGIEAPRSVDIHRKEIYLDIQAENSAASVGPQNLLELIEQSKDS